MIDRAERDRDVLSVGDLPAFFASLTDRTPNTMPSGAQQISR